MFFLFTITTSKDHHTAANYPLSPPFVVNLVSSLQWATITSPEASYRHFLDTPPHDSLQSAKKNDYRINGNVN